MTFFYEEPSACGRVKEKALCSQAEKPACPERHKLHLEGKNRQGGISGGFRFSDGGPKILRVRNVDSWNLRCGSTFMEPLIVFLPLLPPPMPPRVSSVPHTVTLKTLRLVTTIHAQ